MVGIAPISPDFLGSIPPVPPPPDAAPQLGGTMIGHPPIKTEGAAPAPTGGVQHKTLLGIARPGIAPLNPGQPPAPAYAPASAGPYAPPSYAPGGGAPASLPVSAPASSGRRRGEERREPRKRRIPLGAAIAIIAAAALLTAAVVALLLYDSRGALSAEVKLDAEGHERLEITCAKCTDSASVRLGEASARFQGQRAGLALKTPLAIGDNQLALELERTPGKRETVELTVPVEYRVRADTSPLADPKPRVRVAVQAVPGTTAVVDGHPVTLGPDGHGSADLDVASALLGEEETVKRLERRVPYAITPPGSSTQSGDVSFELGIAALTIDAPGDSVVIDTPTFVLAGRTLKGASVTVEGRPITVDASGKFAQMMNVSAQGETTVTVRASAKDQAPRLVPVKIKRVANLASEVARARASAVGSYAEIAGAPESKLGVAVAWDGTVIEARTENFASVVLLDVKSGCAKAPCLARVTYGARAQFASGDRVTAVGKVAGAVDGPRENTRVPAISAEFVVKASK
jgi:hypothetical protein